MRRFDSPSALAASAGEHLGHSDWVTVTQDMIDRFADLTGDHQWIHVDVDRARRESPWGSTIAHGYLMLSLAGTMLSQVYKVQCRRSLNVGSDRLRFLSSVAAGSAIRLSVTLKDCQPASTPGAWRATLDLSLEVKGADKPGFVAQIIIQYFE